MEFGLGRSPRDGVKAKADFSNFPRNVAPDFLHHLSEDPNQGERGRGTMKWLELAYSIISVNAVILALLAVIVNLLGRARSRRTTDAKNNCVNH